MKKLLAVAILALGVSACGTKTVVVEQTPTSAPTQQDNTQSSSNKEQNFLDGLTYDHPTEVSRLGKTNVLELGRLTCGTIDEGATLSDFVEMADSTGVPPEFIGSLIRESVENFCPENKWFIDSALNGNGI